MYVGILDQGEKSRLETLSALGAVEGGGTSDVAHMLWQLNEGILSYD